MEYQYFEMYLATKKHLKALPISTKKKFLRVFSAASYMFLQNALLYNTLANV